MQPDVLVVGGGLNSLACALFLARSGLVVHVLDDKQIVEQELKGHKIDVRIEVEPSQPFGVASYRTKAALRDIRLRRL